MFFFSVSTAFIIFILIVFFLSTFAYYKKFSVTSFPVKMRDNIRNDRLGEQWGSGRSLSSIKKLLEGAYKCFVEVNKDFKKLI